VSHIDIDCFIVMGLGGFFFLLGIILLLGARREEKGYYNDLSRRADLREFLTHWPPRFGTQAFRVGGWISIAIGVVLIILGGVFLI
jgi:hypothetical protein